ncbi:MAG: long-chain fatty acid transporter [Betaproteobacteria bacterium RIFCSPLOWO2_12_FULL_62_58]|nr:MAG: long-chain fatty acid transporter [Betaproteobacteria bacterium RIFCSPLOWO2_12_FULL_62_58]
MRKLVIGLLAAGCLTPGLASATNGYFSHGYGLKAKGMAGASTAVASDTFGGSVNPAKMVFVGDRIDFGADLFSPRRSASRQGETAFGGFYNGSADSDSRYFLIPEFGYNKMINPNLSLGVSVYGNGGMNTDFNTPLAGPPFAACGAAQANMLLGCGKLGVDYMELIVAPTVAYKLNQSHSIGLSPLLGYRRFKVDGLQAFAPISSAPANLTNQGYDHSTGWGVRVGWMGKVSDTVTLGAAYASKMTMSDFDKYRGLFAEQGGFDIPENYNVGIAVQATPTVLVAFDVQRINYGKTTSISNGVLNSIVNPFACPLGSACGSGFSWQNRTYYKLGLEYAYSKELTLRGGFNYGKAPFGTTANDISFNILAPGVVEKHLTLGLTYKTSTSGELTFAYMHAFSNTVTGPSAITTMINGMGFPGSFGTESLKMYQNSFGIAYGWKM